jgi:hypothetical protein
MSSHKEIAVLAAAVGTFLFMTSYVRAVDVHLAWDAPTTDDGTPPRELAGYKLYYGWASRLYNFVIDVGNRTTYMLSGLEAGRQYYFSVVAYDHALNESPLSEELSAIIPAGPGSDGTDSEGDVLPEDDETATYGTDPLSANPTSTPIPAANDWTNYWVSLTMRSDDDGAIGVMFRYQDPDNHYRFSWHSDGVYGRLIKCYNGAFTLLAEHAIPYVPGQPYQVDIVADGETLEVSFEGTPIFSVIDSDLNAGSIGLYTWFSDGSSFDDILVQDLHTNAVLLLDDFNGDDFTSWTIVDEGTWMAPSAWSVSDRALRQSSKIYSEATDPTDIANHGTYALYTR